MEFQPPVMLDTNIASLAIRGGNAALEDRLSALPVPPCISAITEAELLFGLARRPDARKLHAIVSEFLGLVAVLPWTSAAASAYADLRAALEQAGTPLGAMDMLIAAHARAEAAILISNNKALLSLGHLVQVEDWSAD